MKRLFSICLCIAVLFGTIAGMDLTANAAELTSGGLCGEHVTYTFDKAEGLLVISGSGEMNDYAPTASPFYNQDGIQSVIIHTGVTSVGDCAFKECAGLENITLADSVERIDLSAFSGCSDLTAVTIPAAVHTIEEAAFAYCNSLTQIHVDAANPDYCSMDGNLYSKDKSVFVQYAPGRESDCFTLPDGVASISGGAFMTAFSLTEVLLPDSLASIGASAFANCINLKELNLPEGITDIGSSAFYGCSGLTHINIPDGVTALPHAVFSYCSGLRDVALPDTLAFVGGDAFSFCAGLTELCLPDGVCTIGDCAFFGCTGLEKFVFPKCLTKIGDRAFEGCTALTEAVLNEGVQDIPARVFYGCAALMEAVIPNSADSIESGAFYNCVQLKKLTLPCSSVIRSADAFFGCTNIAEVHLTRGDGAMQQYTTNSGDVLYYGYTPWYYSRNSIEQICLDEGIESISGYSFYNCSGLTQIVVPDSVQTIGDYAFGNCSGLSSITIGQNVSDIGTHAFDFSNVTECILLNEYYDCMDIAMCLPKGAAVYAYAGSNAAVYCTIYNLQYVPLEEQGCGLGFHKYDIKETHSYCEAVGETIYACRYCGDIYSEKTAPVGHTVVTDEAVAPSCTAAGCTQGSHCGVCGMVLEAQKPLPASGHDYQCAVTKAATCTQAGVMTYTCSICKQVYTKPIAKRQHIYADIVTKATADKNGSIITKCTGCGKISKSKVIYCPKTVSLSKTRYVYDGKVKTPSVTVKGSDGRVIQPSDYTVTYSKGRKNAGKYTVKITFKGNYNATLATTFVIAPKGTELRSLTPKTKGFSAKWKKNTTQTSGYQLQYSTSSTFSKAKTVTVSKNQTTGKNILKLRAKKKYYVRIRTYKTVKFNGKSQRLYSAWSKAKTVRTKK